MEKFILTGKYHDKFYNLFLPTAKHFEPLSADDLNSLDMQLQRSSTSELEDLESELKILATDPMSMFKDRSLFQKLTLKNCYSKHAYPVAQGPVVPPRDITYEEYSTQKVFASRTEYVHSHQECLEWIPIEIGLDIFKKEMENKNDFDIQIDAVFELKKRPQLNIKGAASLKDMSILYTCKLQNCIIHCPCTVCRIQKNDCRVTCKQYSCETCSSQCTQHEAVGLARQFDPKTDHLTIVTDNLTYFRHAIPYPGIPLTCERCTKDVYEHQILHHVFHLRCKFCRLEARPYEEIVNSSLKDFKQAVSFFKKLDNRTCSFCFLVLGDIDRRKNHENRIHLNKESKHKCETCDKSYMNKNALAYHMENHNKEFVKFSCEDCGKQYKSQQGLAMHTEIVHEKKDKPKLPCSYCDAIFSTKSNFNRHMRTVHEEDATKINVDFLPPMKELPKFQCLDCNAMFKRKDHLKRHIKCTHDNIQEFSCSLCSKKFQRKDILSRHMKWMHKK